MAAPITPERPGWELRRESAPSLCKHFLPLFGGGHVMKNTCWCEPFVQNEASYTVVMHNDAASHGLRHWPFASQVRQI